MLSKPAATKTLFPTYPFPSTHTSPLLQAAHIFSHLTAYILTHAHLDHAMSLAIASGSLPSLPDDDQQVERQQRQDSPPGRKLRTPVFGSKSTLEKLSVIYNGDLWPELGKWSEEEDAPPTPPVTSLPDGPGPSKRKRKRESSPILDPPEILTGAGVQYCP